MENIDYDSSWKLIKKTFPILNDNFTFPLESEQCSEGEFYQTLNLIIQCDLVDVIQSLIIEKIEKYSRNVIKKDFWAHFNDVSDENEGFRRFYKAVESLYVNYSHFKTTLAKLNALRIQGNENDLIYGEKNAEDAFKLIIRSCLLSELPLNCQKVIKNFYEVALKNEGIEFSKSCSVCLSCNGCECLQHFYETNKILIELGLLEPFVQHTILNVINNHIEEHIESVCKDRFDVSFVDSLQKWLEDVILVWLTKIYSSKTVLKFHKKLKSVIFEVYTKIRINQLFSIIIEYPESTPALEDLSICLPKTDLRPYLIKKLQKSMETRLLHPGVGTHDVLTAYVATIRSMRVLDRSGLLLETITQPIHQYLRSREDTVRCVVTSLMEEGSNDLAEELIRGDVVQTDDNASSDEDDLNWEQWMPDPIEAKPGKSSNTRRTTDIISMLVNVYGSKDLFVNEYRTLLADRLLTSLTCDTDKEIRYLELLKLRFGDAQLHLCEVMLKDITDSKRINQHVQQDENYRDDDVPISAMILSAQFWPAFKEEKCELHQSVNDQMNEYTKVFENFKGSRTLCWKKHLGSVDLDIELPNRTVSFSAVTPMHATIIMHFQDKNLWNLSDLSKIMQVPPTLLKRKIVFWQSHGLINEIDSNTFQLIEDTKGESSQTSKDIVIEDESESAMASSRDQREEELQTIWSYIVGMLMNLDSLNLERIHQMLKMFAFQVPSVECNVQELKHFLDRKVREHQLVYSGGVYRLPKP
ncbi:anaphase-promoting complex subunit 2 [Onthophagus taurus]|uniref:anaphase-promoting complex subunit 2 n=1 Tax=Onthophagus taurus TaxID=166361 RepID=UPI000C1FE206|nr:anaphase-promoting complex subunit 2 [Onthophagus taurus]